MSLVAKSLGEAVIKAVARISEGVSPEQAFRGELRDYLAHSVAKFCKRHDSMKHYDILAQFVEEVLRDVSGTGGAQ
jgi:hypothetical protein